MGRLVISRSSPFISTLLRMYHDSPMGGILVSLKLTKERQLIGIGLV